MERVLRYYGDPVLRQRARRVDRFDDQLRDLLASLLATMRRAGGIGLAAPQMGESIRAIVVRQMASSEDEDAQALVLVNPEVIERSRETWVNEEGCLSLPGIVGDVTRSLSVQVRYQDLEGNEHTCDAEGMFARILLHEIDHLDGRLFIDYLSAAKKSLLKPALKEIAARRSA